MRKKVYTHFAPAACMSKSSDDGFPSMRHFMQKILPSSFMNSALFSHKFLTRLPKHSRQYACLPALRHETVDAIGTSASKHMQHSMTSCSTAAAAGGKCATVTGAVESDTDTEGALDTDDEADTPVQGPDEGALDTTHLEPCFNEAAHLALHRLHSK